MSEGKRTRRVKTPLLLQLEAVECGAAALGIMLEYFGRIVPLTQLREACGIARDGSKAANIMKASKRYGLECRAFKESLQSAMERPCPYIAYWNFNHFLVIEGFDPDNDRVYLNDPAHGHSVVTMQDFDDSFTGIILTFEPTPDFQRGGSRPGVFDGIRQRLSASRTTLVYLFLVGLILTLPGLIIPAYTRVFLDQVLGQDRDEWYKPLLFVFGVTVLFKLSAEIVKYHCLRRFRIHLSASMSSQFLQHLLKLPLRFYSQRYAGEIAVRQKLNDKIADILSGKLADTAINVLMMVFYGILMFYYNWKLTLVGITFVSVSFIALHLLGRIRKETNMRLRQDMGKVAGDAVAALQSMETIKASGQESAFFTKWSGRYAKSLNTMTELQVTTQTITVLPPLFRSLNTAAIYLIGGLAVISGEMSIGTLVAFTALMSTFQNPVSDLVNLGTDLQELYGDMQRLDDVLLAEVDPAVVDEGEIVHQEARLQLTGAVLVRAVTFGYSPIETPLFENITINMVPGRWYAFVGGSGSGKTTMANIVCGLHEPWQGQVLFDGRPWSQIPRSVKKTSFAKVSQEVFLVRGTVRENLTMWDSTVPESALVQACKDACILDVVQALREGFDAEVLEGGANFSGGQRQRLELARALVHNPRILVLDEATSALDTETEALIIERLRRRGLTCILVAHRLSTVRDADEIIVFEHGEIVERGNHQELWDRRGVYANLIRAGQGPAEELG